MFDNMLGFGQTDRHHGQLNQTETNEKRAVAPFSMFDEDFGFENMFGRMRNMMSSMEKQFVSCSSVVRQKVCYHFTLKRCRMPKTVLFKSKTGLDLV